MQLEKVTTGNNEASIAGWISSNDATLFTTVLVVAAAIFLHSKLAEGARDYTALEAEKALLAENLAAKSDELAGLSDTLRQTSERLNLTQEERDQLRRELAQKLAEVAALNAKLDQLLAQHTELEGERAAVSGERDALAAANLSLREQLHLLTAQLEEKIAAMESLAAARDRLQRQADELDGIVASLRSKLEQLNIELVDAKEESAAQLAESQQKVDELQARLAVSAKQAEDYLAQLKRAQELSEGLQLEKQQLQQALTDAERLRQQQLLEEGRNNRELVGLRGPLRRVALVIDASGSMRQGGVEGGGDRWAEVQSIAAKWLQHLTVEECALIVFSNDVRTFPEDGTLVDVRGEEGKARRDALLRQLKSVQPGGWTNTLAALQKAYAYDVDTVLLFTDGSPSRADTGLFDPVMANQIYELCRQHPNVPVNTVGLGDYFDDTMATFLRTVADITGGTFRGQ